MAHRNPEPRYGEVFPGKLCLLQKLLCLMDGMKIRRDGLAGGRRKVSA
ncbi:hypothetical protein NBRC3257_0911 [Gluconobacter thailandicus NBRC 3257]|uniref:Transposase n=1 Tax=Gluconobacter thailandicus NBRC 3257 TaxID=1381097 RepID=A0ABQ0IUP3_GLUTH|nr:hypothetical protein B932_1547 [Gluconobacter oxydans H24]GAC86351.1 hypothetical protein NBRC3255_0012 [Gluconobacter thailandicus NBRC 3255]GAD25912.1 hypothetical protein NBRC3257_0911 [Gluconobacter thailandicus NBRC 3257]